MSRRILPAEVVAAYRATGVRPARGTLAQRDETGEIAACCGIGVLYLHVVGAEAVSEQADSGFGIDDAVVMKTLGVSMDYYYGFQTGFDGREPGMGTGPDLVDGMIDGAVAWMIAAPLRQQRRGHMED